MAGAIWILTLWLGSSYLISLWAKNWGRDQWFWGILSFFFSAVIIGWILLFAGKKKKIEKGEE